MSDTLLNLTTPALPEATCWPATPQDLADLIFPLSKAVLPGGSGTSLVGIVVRDTAPTELAYQENYAWAQVSGDGNLLGLWLFNGSKWIRPHRISPNDPSRLIYTGLESSLLAYDGGDGNPTPTLTGGPFWQVDHDMDFCFPLGAGTNPVAYAVGPGTATVYNVGDTGGEELHLLTKPEIPRFDEQIGLVYKTAGGTVQALNLDSGGNVGTGDPAVGIGIGASGGQTKPQVQTGQLGIGGAPLTGIETPHNTMPPFKAVFFLKRTIRQFYSITP